MICFHIGRGERIRTSDPLLPKQVRYQAALRPDNVMNGRECDAFHITSTVDKVRDRHRKDLKEALSSD
jgi:hypothetical protein